ncbi:MAG TPA: MFS transporter [Sphingobacterium sp.]|nr:MFS transporter [Sphingobacterium sp.]
MSNQKPTSFRWTVCALLFFATTVNYLDRQVLSLTWKDFIAPEFHWTNSDYGNIAGIFTFVYSVSMLISGRLVDWFDTKKGYAWAIIIWSIGAILHAFTGIATSGYLTGEWFVTFAQAKENIALIENTSRVINVSVVLFIIARAVLAFGEGGNFPAAIKATAEYFPKKDRAFSTSIFNAGTTVGALASPLIIPLLAEWYGWETSFVIIGGLGFVWLGFWQFLYKKPEENPRVNQKELEYINQDVELEDLDDNGEPKKEKVKITTCLKFRQTWLFIVGKFMTDGVWWFLLFWIPAYLSSIYDIKSSDFEGQAAIFVLYAITLLSIIGGWLPTYFVDKKGMDPYQGRMRAMLIFAFFPLLILFAQPLGTYSYWFPVLLIGIGAAAHQSWSANIFSTVGDMFPKRAIATVTGIGGLAGGLGSFLINIFSGHLFDYAELTQLTFMGFRGEEAGYFIVFTFCAVAYLIAWIIMKTLVPKMETVRFD